MYVKEGAVTKESAGPRELQSLPEEVKMQPLCFAGADPRSRSH